MNENKDYEFVSAAMDDDGLSQEVLDKLLSDKRAQQKWREYHIIRDCMQKAQFDMGAATAAKEPSAAGQPLSGSAGRPVAGVRRNAANQVFGGFAVAASVLAVAVGVWQFFPTGSQNVAGVAAAEQPSDKGNGQNGIVSVGGKTKQADALGNAEAQGAVVPHAARAHQNEATENKAVRVEKMPPENGASGVK